MTTANIRGALLEQYELGSRVSQAQGLRCMRTSILAVVLESGDLGPQPSLIARRVLAAISTAPLTGAEEESFLDELIAFMVRKNGNALVLKDAEDAAVRACFCAFESSVVPDETPFEIADEVEMLLAGKIGPITCA